MLQFILCVSVISLSAFLSYEIDKHFPHNEEDGKKTLQHKFNLKE